MKVYVVTARNLQNQMEMWTYGTRAEARKQEKRLWLTVENGREVYEKVEIHVQEVWQIVE